MQNIVHLNRCREGRVGGTIVTLICVQNNMTKRMADHVTVQTDPTLREAGNLIINSRDRGEYITVLGRCRVEYDGRATSTLGYGDRHITLQPDGCVRVDTDEDRKPVNWQPPGAEYRARMTEEETLHVHAKRTNPTETLDIEFTNVYFVTATEMQDEAELTLVGTEQDMQDHLMDNPEPISEALGEPFIPLEAEYSLDSGDVDVFGRTDADEAVVVELKRRTVGPEAVSQLHRYVDEISHTEPVVHGVLVAPSLTDGARHQLEEYGFIHVPFTPEDTKADLSRPDDASLTDYN